MACGGAGIEGIGDTMRDAGEAMAGIGGSMLGGAGASGASGSAAAGKSGASGARAAIGGMLAAAGATVAQAGRAMAGAAAGSGGGVAGAEAQEPASDGLPRPHWVLRDKSGAPVQADVAPGYASSTPGFGEAADCVTIAHAGQRRIGLSYVLSTGKLALPSECASSGIVSQQAWRPASIWYVFADSACETPLTSYAVTIAIGGTYYHSATGAPSSPNTFYSWNADSQTCAAVQNTSGAKFWAFAAIPQSVLELLPRAPYTLELAY
jgi:hypothetical protein